MDQPRGAAAGNSCNTQDQARDDQVNGLMAKLKARLYNDQAMLDSWYQLCTEIQRALDHQAEVEDVKTWKESTKASITSMFAHDHQVINDFTHLFGELDPSNPSGSSKGIGLADTSSHHRLPDARHNIIDFVEKLRSVFVDSQQACYAEMMNLMDHFQRSNFFTYKEFFRKMLDLCSDVNIPLGTPQEILGLRRDFISQFSPEIPHKIKF